MKGHKNIVALAAERTKHCNPWKSPIYTKLTILTQPSIEYAYTNHAQRVW